jgi:DNA-binding response OmpR family regulator
MASYDEADKCGKCSEWVNRNYMGKTILLVDDDTDLLELLSQTFTEAGFSIATATNGLDALKMARSLSPDLIVLDLILPEQDGFTVCETLRREHATAGIPIIMLTGLIGQLSRYSGLGCGANDYVMKPVTPKQLMSRMEPLLSRSTKGATQFGTTIRPVQE